MTAVSPKGVSFTLPPRRFRTSHAPHRSFVINKPSDAMQYIIQRRARDGPVSLESRQWRIIILLAWRHLTGRATRGDGHNRCQRPLCIYCYYQFPRNVVITRRSPRDSAADDVRLRSTDFTGPAQLWDTIHLYLRRIFCIFVRHK